MTAPQRIIGVVGWKNSGKTRMVAALVAELTGRGWKVSTIKHAHHAFDIDKPGADSWQHRQAGASEVAIVSGRRWALMHENTQGESEPPLDEIVGKLSPCDIVLVEGYKRGDHDKIEIRRAVSETGTPLAPGDAHVVAVVGDAEDTDRLPVFPADAIADIADFIERHTGLRNGEPS